MLNRLSHKAKAGSKKMQMRQRAVKGDVDDVGVNADAHDGDLTRSARRALKRVDVYPKMHREFKVQTEFGATGASSHNVESVSHVVSMSC